MDNDFSAVRGAYTALDNKFGIDIVVLDIREQTSFADYFVIATGGSSLQIQAMAAAAEEAMGKGGYKLRHTEGLHSNWMLLDFGDIVIHLFDKEGRQFYNLERIWGDAKVINMSSAQ